MDKEQIKAIMKELFKSGEIRVEVESEESEIFDTINTNVRIYIGNECVSNADY